MSNIKSEIRKGVIVNSIGKYSGIFIQIGISAFLARLLTPEEFGIVAVVTVFINFFKLLGNFGFGAAIVQETEIDKNKISSFFWLVFIIAAILAFAFYISAPLIANYYENINYIQIVHILSLVIFFSTINLVPSALLYRNKRFKQIAFLPLAINMLTGILAIYLAKRGYSYNSLIIRAVVASIIVFFTNYIVSGINISFYMQLSLIRHTFRYSFFQFVFNFINYFSRNLDNLLIGKYFSLSFLGIYDKAYKLMLLPVNNLTHVITPVLHPILSPHKKDKNFIYINYRKIVNLFGLIGIPIAVVCFFTASELILILYGDQWKDAIPVFRILSVSIWIQIILSSSGSIFQVLGRTDKMSLSGFISAICIISGILAGIFWKKNLEAVAWGINIAMFVNFIQTYFILVVTIFKQSLLGFLSILIKPFLIGTLMVSGNLLLELFGNFSENIFVSLGLKLAVSAAMFFTGLLITGEKNRLKKMFSR